MTVQYAKVFEQLDKNIYDVNPANYTGAYSKFGKFDMPTPDPWNDMIFHVNAVEKVTNVRFGDSFKWGDGDAILHPGTIKAKWVSWSYTLDEKQMHSISDNPSGHFAQQVASGLQAQQSRFATELDYYLIGYLYGTTSDQDYDPEYTPLLKLRNTTNETVGDPQDVSSAAGTITNLSAVNFTGSNQTVDAVAATFGISRDEFYKQYDSTTKEAMFKGTTDDQGAYADTFDVFGHPAVWQKLRMGHEANASGERDYARNYIKILNDAGFNPVGTYAVDAAYDGATTTVAQLVMTMNTAENFKVSEIIPYTVEPWMQFNDPQRGIVYRKRGYMKVLPYRVPYYLNSAYKKAMLAFSITPYENT